MTQVSEQDAAQTAPEPGDGVRGRRGRLRRRFVLSRISIQSKLILMLVLCAILAAAVVGGIAFTAGREALRTAVFNRLVQVREFQTKALENQISDLKDALVVYTHGGAAQAALRDFTAGFDQLATSTVKPEQWQSVMNYYNNDFIKQTQKYTGNQLDPDALLPTSPAQRYLQANYTAQRQNDDAALAMTDARDGSAWSAANARYQDYFREIVTRFEFQDALLIDGRGNVVYSAYKDVDLGTNILNGPYSGSLLHDAYQKAMSANEVDFVAFTDFEFYQPAEGQPTAWMVAPLPPNGKAEGVLALQFPIAKINRLMTFDRNWQSSGLGRTGETYLVGSDGLMRSDSRMFLENPQQYKKDVVQAGTPPDVADMAIRLGGTTLVQPAASAATREAQKGLSGTLITNDYLGQRALQAYAPLVSKGSDLHWSIIATVSTDEAFDRESNFTRVMVLATTGIIFLVCILAIFLAQVFLRPIRRLEEGAHRISEGDYDVAIPVETRDEIGDLTRSFNEMSRSLTVKEDLLNQQRTENEQLLRSLMPDMMAERYMQGEEIIATEHQNVSVIFADIIGLDRLQAELTSNEMLAMANDLSRQIDAAAEEFGVERVRTVRNGYLASCGLTVPRLDNARRMVEFALECQRIIDRFNNEADTDLKLRAGIDSGNVSSGLVGRPSVIYDMWGSAVNLARQVKNGVTQPGIYVTARVHDVLAETITFAEAGSVTIDDEPEPIWRIPERD